MAGPVTPALESKRTPENGKTSLDMEGLSLSALKSKGNWDRDIAMSLDGIAPFAAMVSLLSQLHVLKTDSNYTKLIRKIASQNSSLTAEESNLKVRVDKLVNDLWYFNQAKRFLDYFINLMRDKLQRDPDIISTDFDEVFRSNEVILRELQLLPGKVVDPVTNTLLSKSSFERQAPLLDTVRNVCKDLWGTSASFYAGFIKESGRNFPN